MLTHRVMRDPLRHLLYDNLDDFIRATESWLTSTDRKPAHSLGVGVDRSDSLLYEGVIPHVRSLAELFGDLHKNKNDNRLILLTKSINTHYLEDIRPENRRFVVVTFSLNPESIADLWEGKWPDTRTRITPPIAERLKAAQQAQELGFEIRARLDPVLAPPNWVDCYAEFVSEVQRIGLSFRYWTLGTFRQKNPQLDAWRERWGLIPLEWDPSDGDLVQDGTHLHLPEQRRIRIYSVIAGLIRSQFPDATIGLCKETHSVRRLMGLSNAKCNCLL
jgi:hypothetical protein